MDIFTAIRELTRFDHAACDAQIVARHLRLEHLVFKGGSSNEGVYVGSVFITVWFGAIIAVTINAYRNRPTLSRKERVWLWFGPFMCTFGIGFVVVQAMGLIEYAEVCRSVLHVS